MYVFCYFLIRLVAVCLFFIYIVPTECLGEYILMILLSHIYFLSCHEHSTYTVYTRTHVH